MNMKRMRGRNQRGSGGPIRQQSGNVPMNRNHVFDSSGPDIRIRGTSQQLFEKYLQMGRDATSVGDRVMAESYFQYAEHYFRILSAMNQAAQQTQGGQAGGQGAGQGGGQQGYGGGNGYRRNDSQMTDGGAEDQGEAFGGDARAIPIAAGAPEDTNA